MLSLSGSAARVQPTDSIGIGLGLSAGVVGCLLTLVGAFECSSCANAVSSAHRLTALLGGLAYCAAILLLGFLRTQLLALVLVVMCSGVHGVLLKFMLDAGELCLGCATSGAGILFALVITVKTRVLGKRLAWTTGLLGGLLGMLLFTGFAAAQQSSREEPLPAELADFVRRAGEHCERRDGRACLVVFEKKGCAACAVVKNQSDLRQLEQKSGMSIRVTRLGDLHSSDFPIVVVLTARDVTVFRGSPTQSQLLSALTHR